MPVLLKPHLFVVPLGLIYLVALRQRQWRVVGAVAGMLAFLALATVALDPNWLRVWLAEGPPLRYQSTSLWDLLARLFAWPQWVPLLGLAAGGAVALVGYRRVEQITPDRLAGATVVSFLLSPYVWRVDALALLPAVVTVGAALWRRGPRWLLGVQALLWAAPILNPAWLNAVAQREAWLQTPPLPTLIALMRFQTAARFWLYALGLAAVGWWLTRHRTPVRESGQRAP